MALKVLHYIPKLDWSGAPFSGFYLARALRATGWDSRVLTLHGGPMEGLLKAESVPIYRVKPSGFGLAKRRFKNGVKERLRDIRPHVLHLNHAEDSAARAAEAATSFGIPVAWHIREDALGKRVRRLWPAMKNMSRLLVTVSEAMEKDFRVRAGFSHVRTVYNGLDEAFFTGRLPEIAVSLDKAMFGTPNPDVADVRKRWSIPEGLPVVGTVGRAKPRKGTMVFMEAAARVLERTDAFFVAAGFDSKRDDAAPYRNSVRNFIRSKNMGHRVKLLPPAMVTPAFYRALDIFVLPSTWEGCSRTLLEAMCCERAVAASRVGGNPEVLDGGRAGKLFPPGDADALAACLHDLLESPSERHALAAKGRKRFEGCFTMEKHAAQMEEIFMTLAGQTSQRAGAP